MTESSVVTLVALLVYLIVSVWLGILAQRTVEKSSFLQGYFLGNRGLGAWALALTATVQSGGTFMGYPSLVYSHGWIVGLWIASYMVVPITNFGIFGKRLAQLSRRTNAITVPDLFRERFDSPAAGLVASFIVIISMLFMLIAQFKAGGVIMKVVAGDMLTQGLTLIAPEFARPTNPTDFDPVFFAGLALFAAIVVGYTMIGGFLAAVWTDLFQSVLMAVGVLVLLCLTFTQTQIADLQGATQEAVARSSASYAYGPGHSTVAGHEFLPPSLAISYFFVWIFGGVGSPATLTRLMACKDTDTIRRSILLLSVYNVMIYLPLLVICVAARSILPDLENTDAVVPTFALVVTKTLSGGSLWAALILVAPFGAIMATLSSYLVVIASGLVRDVYQRFINPGAGARELMWISYAVMVAAGLLGILANLQPVKYLQAIVVFCGSTAAAAFVAPVFMLAYWRRASAAGAIAGMLAGATTMAILYGVGFNWPDPSIGMVTTFRPYYFLRMDPVVWGLLASSLASILVSRATKPPRQELIDQLF